jgi:purine-nucleoside phosphorylase
MYKSYTADDFRLHLGLPIKYNVEGFLIFGTVQKFPYEMLKETLRDRGLNPAYSTFEKEFLSMIQEFSIDGKYYWFVVGYGGALISEYLHLASLFGSKKNILLGSCGGLKPQAKASEIIIPKWSYAEESSAKAYGQAADNRYNSNEALSDRLAERLSSHHMIHRGGTITYQAMLGETADDISRWSKQGYAGVEMEAATVFAVSNHFGVPAAAVLQIADNLIEDETMLDDGYADMKNLRRSVTRDTFDAAIAELLS